MRYFIGFLCVVVLGVGAWLVWRYEGQLNDARAEAEQLKADRDMAKADAEKMKAALEKAGAEGDQYKRELAMLKDSLKPIREGETFPRPALDRKSVV